MSRPIGMSVRAHLPTVAGYAAAAAAAAAILIGASKPHDGLKPGARVSYAEDYLGRPWRVVGERGPDRIELRCGKLRVLAERKEITPYAPPRPTATTLLASDVGR